MVLIKLGEVPHKKEELKEKAQGAWRININRLYGQDVALVLYQGKILEVYKILSYEKDSERSNRVVFQLEEIKSDLRGKKITSRTSNPCTIIEDLEFK